MCILLTVLKSIRTILIESSCVLIQSLRKTSQTLLNLHLLTHTHHWQCLIPSSCQYILKIVSQLFPYHTNLLQHFHTQMLFLRKPFLIMCIMVMNIQVKDSQMITISCYKWLQCFIMIRMHLFPSMKYTIHRHQ
jgi:hypothetical protein